MVIITWSSDYFLSNLSLNRNTVQWKMKQDRRTLFWQKVFVNLVWRTTVIFLIFQCVKSYCRRNELFGSPYLLSPTNCELTINSIWENSRDKSNCADVPKTLPAIFHDQVKGRSIGQIPTSSTCMELLKLVLCWNCFKFHGLTIIRGDREEMYHVLTYIHVLYVYIPYLNGHPISA